MLRVACISILLVLVTIPGSALATGPLICDDGIGAQCGWGNCPISDPFCAPPIACEDIWGCGRIVPENPTPRVEQEIAYLLRKAGNTATYVQHALEGKLP